MKSKNNKVMKEYFYSFTKKCLLTAVILLLMLPSCNEDILQEKPLDFFSPDNAFLTEQGVVQGIVALHDRVRSAYYSFGEFGTMSWRVHGSDLGYMGEAPQHNTYYINSYQDVNPIRRYVVDTWNTGFQIIQWANVLIEKIGELDAGIFQDGEAGKNLYLGEARFFRAFAYRYLVSTYGDIPLLKEPVKTAKADFVRDPVSEIHKLMEEDFKFASEHLPNPGDEAAPGRITKGPALHYLGETYLEKGEPQLAVDALTKAVDNFSYDLMTERFGNHLDKDIFGSGDAYYDLFGYENHNRTENKEAMWVIQVEPFIQGGGFVQGAYIFGPRYFDIGLTPDGYQAILGTIYDGRHTGYSDTLSRGTANVRGSSLVYYTIWQSDWDNDTRNAEHNLKRNIYFDNPASAYHGQKIDFSLYDPPRPNPLEDTTKCLFPVHTKFLDPLNYFEQPNRAGGGRTHKDWYALRFAETLLLRAEAYLGISKPDLAAADVNRVRARANASPVSSAAIDIDYILDERARELYGEEWRLIILRRTNKLVERVRKYNDNPVLPGADIEPHNVLWPIPQNQIDLNVDAEFPQNPGYE
ncbi:RagB/SusD family nutrient uptake outer membrane protein [Mariniphaga sediminis]|uniref:RagB/SusD family nutrient uptake outer membrane protein n=1 Tax=Mariniphaga sediminis TaxID=1628158 RepID=A0A399CXZ5_9BACT|nr:RagB/SusD family nutrient uptake outer membrane protein [Mariniphaga sediminis]RIH64299.1 RagB/SusD family nutrient uptake outer membrane protein [Mariniphaga sediminis]RIH66578.1 RagB/SusD family nutrient uptake outer membrane protein [Mariniphaga sediminis]